MLLFWTTAEKDLFDIFVSSRKDDAQVSQENDLGGIDLRANMLPIIYENMGNSFSDIDILHDEPMKNAPSYTPVIFNIVPVHAPVLLNE
jgi:hypothetical protein